MKIKLLLLAISLNCFAQLTIKIKNNKSQQIYYWGYDKVPLYNDFVKELRTFFYTMGDIKDISILREYSKDNHYRVPFVPCQDYVKYFCQAAEHKECFFYLTLE
ncbi:hypothetical protein A3F66_01765 [candidate division TM6 bacterium RIFCSPHIGHO2_12_FULL_32_22]|nr:MAG: hypothetical protein A3F66_01765 [candidate division TM6 bacterium RIFCSPHIGHO2_12_FULL_32_22]